MILTKEKREEKGASIYWADIICSLIAAYPLTVHLPACPFWKLDARIFPGSRITVPRKHNFGTVPLFPPISQSLVSSQGSYWSIDLSTSILIMLVNVPLHLVLHSAGDQSQYFVHELRRAFHQMSYNISLKVQVLIFLLTYLLSLWLWDQALLGFQPGLLVCKGAIWPWRHLDCRGCVL